MNDAKYIGMDVHTANDLGGGSGFERESSDGSHARNERRKAILGLFMACAAVCA